MSYSINHRHLILLSMLACGQSDSDADLEADTDVTDTGPLPPLPTPSTVVQVGPSMGMAPRLTGTNKGPISESRLGDETFDYTSLLKAFGVSGIRLHDGDIDICKIYQDDSLTRTSNGEELDPDSCVYTPSGAGDSALWSVKDPASINLPIHYDFSEADAAYNAVLSGGFEPWIRLGDSYNGPNDNNSASDWSKVAENIYKHYAVGWPDSPIDTTLAPPWVEIHNEPDGFFWLGSNAQFYEMYESTYEAVTAITDPNLPPPKVGGSGFTHNGVEAWLVQSSGNLVADFLDSFSTSRLDYLSVHHYNDCEEATLGKIASYLTEVRASLDEASTKQIPIAISEWNIGLGSACGHDFFTNTQTASYVAAVMAIMAAPDLKVERAHFYSSAPSMSLFGQDEKTLEFSVNPSAWAFRASAMVDGTELLETLICDGDGSACETTLNAAHSNQRISAVAGYNDAGQTIVVLTNYSDTATTAEVRLENTPALWEVIRFPSAPQTLSSEISTNGHLTPTDAAMDALLALETVETPLALSNAASVPLEPWEVVVLRAEPSGE